MADIQEQEAKTYIENAGPRQSLSAAPKTLLITTLETLLEAHPVPRQYNDQLQKGVFSGYTSLAYLLLQISRLHPDVTLNGLSLLHHAARYLEPSNDQPELKEMNGGLHSERLSVHALRACISKNDADVQNVLDDVPLFLSDEYPDELFYGRAGVLHLLRLVAAWVPDASSKIDDAATMIVDKILKSRVPGASGYGGWRFLGNRYIGPAHGDIGIIVQVVRSKPSAAGELRDLLREIMSLQQPNGNWPKSDTIAADQHKELVQWCHGAPGMAMSLQAVAPFYPELKADIDQAVDKAIALTWEKGLSRKEPSMCHGIFGNSLVLPLGDQRTHFLAQAEPAAIEGAKADDPDIFKTASYSAEISPFLTYTTSAAWAWAVCEMEEAPMIGYTDV
ncbi:hypothetical protein NLG97_g2890 [Lecanicillium saksenae]|uniref:Uncharacterized protein n=1 Tax=Lecanicillium saksenae TaxID=468837 RepID=A0ACC1R1F4_9HYPO|nr:hypothetical protein NLG97_g2890 [Lecanicillium saksenae]